MRNIFILFVLTFSLVSCNSFFESTIPIDVPDVEPLLVIHALGDIETDSLTVLITHGTAIDKDPNNLQYFVKDAKVTISNSKNDIFNFEEIDLMQEYDTSFYFNGMDTMFYVYKRDYTYNYISHFDDFMEEGETYELKVEKEGYADATASQTIPFKSKIDSAVFRENAGVDIGGNEQSAIDVFIADNVDVENFMRFTFYRCDNVNNCYESYVVSLDPAVFISNYSNSVLISDASYNGESKVIRFTTNRSEAVEGYLVVEDITEDEYLFERTAIKQQEVDGDPFAAPVQIYTNISNGIGIFTLSNSQMVEVR